MFFTAPAKKRKTNPMQSTYDRVPTSSAEPGMLLVIGLGHIAGMANFC